MRLPVKYNQKIIQNKQKLFQKKGFSVPNSEFGTGKSGIRNSKLFLQPFRPHDGDDEPESGEGGEEAADPAGRAAVGGFVRLADEVHERFLISFRI